MSRGDEKLARSAAIGDLLRSSLLLLPAYAVLAWHAHKYWPFLSDDAMISLVYARRLADGHGLTWSDGQRVEGYTDLLWVLMMSIARLFRRDLIEAARTMDAIGAAIAIAMVARSARRLRIEPLRVVSGGVFLALCAPLAVWTIGALEHAFVAGVLAASLVAIRHTLEADARERRVYLVAGVLLAGLVLLRADGAVLVFAIAAGMLLSARLSWTSIKRVVAVLGLPILTWCGQLVFRVLYYGKWVPHTAAVKVNLNWHRVERGYEHVLQGLTPVMPIVALAVLGVLVSRGRIPQGRWIVPATVFVLWSIYVLLVGGDIFPGWRQLLFALIALAMVVAEGAEAVVQNVRQRGWLVPAVAAPALLTSLHFQGLDSENQRAIKERWEWDGFSIGHVMRVAFGRSKPLLAIDAAGALPYWSGLPSLDMLGLNDIHIAAHPPPNFGLGGIGHELGDGAYVLSRKPDIIAFNNAAGSWDPTFLSGRQMQQSPEFSKHYQKVRVVGQRGNRATGDWWVRREDGILGVRRHPDRVEIPGYLFASGSAKASLVGQHLVTHVARDALAEVPALVLPAGRWRLQVTPESPKLRVGYRCGATAATRTGTGSSVLELEREMKVDILLALHGTGSVPVHGATISKTNATPTIKCRRPNTPADVPLAALGNVKQENSLWDHPTNALFDTGGLVVRLPVPARAAWLDLTVDNNDIYVVRYLLDGKEVGTSRIEPRANGGGLAQHRIATPDGARSGGFNSLEVRGDGGDGRYSLGHLLLIEM